MERVIRTIKEELLWLNDFSSFERAYEAIEAWIRNDYNRLHVHSALGYRSVLEYRHQWEQHQSQLAILGGCRDMDRVEISAWRANGEEIFSGLSANSQIYKKGLNFRGQYNHNGY